MSSQKIASVKRKAEDAAKHCDCEAAGTDVFMSKAAEIRNLEMGKKVRSLCSRAAGSTRIYMAGARRAAGAL